MLRVVLLLALVLCHIAVRAAPDSPRNQVAFYVETYGRVTPSEDPAVGWAYQVFERVVAVADKNSKRLPKLVVVRNKRGPWAIALPDGHIVLSSEAVALCQRQASATEAAARLAFVLGHELAHLAHDDFWHQEVHGFLAAAPETRDLARALEARRDATGKELAADDAGFIYAALAGYPVEALLRDQGAQPDFLHLWTHQLQPGPASGHPSPDKRAMLLRQRLEEVRGQLGFFDFGVRLSHFDRCADGVYFLRAFQKTFPGREVLNNIGFCHLRMALDEMEPERAHFYWMPLVLDAETRAEALVQRGGPAPKTLRQVATGEAKGQLEEAVDYLRQATEADRSYVPARINLAATYLYLGQPHQARAVLAEARKLVPDDAALQGLEALAIYEQSDVDLDLWPTAVAKLEQLAAHSDAPDTVVFNLARLLAVRPRPAEARVHWNRLAKSASMLPAPIRVVVCREQSSMATKACAQESVRPDRAPPWTWPFSSNGREGRAPRVAEELGSAWRVREFDWQKTKLHGRIFWRADGSAELLELAGFVQMQALKGEDLGKAAELEGYCARPLRRRALAQGVVWSCDQWAALVRDDIVREVWWAAR
ncbi:MAG: M48 family metalloprotease [Burkholderiales bacterium]